MEETLRQNLVTVSTKLCEHTNTGPAVLGRQIVNDPSVLVRIGAGEKTFTVRMYDRLMSGMSALWPSGKKWPAGIPRPAPDTNLIEKESA